MLKHTRASEGWNDKNIGQKGFTLIELLVVIIILGILAAVVVLAVNGLQDTGDENACETERRSVESAAAAYYADQGSWPTSSSALDGSVAGSTTYLRDASRAWTINTDGEARVTGSTSGTGC